MSAAVTTTSTTTSTNVKPGSASLSVNGTPSRSTNGSLQTTANGAKTSSNNNRGTPPKNGGAAAAVNASPVPRRTKSSTTLNSGLDGAAWGSNFWVTLVDPQSQSAFYACPATGEVSWDAPVNNFVLPPSEQGEWWELHDETRDLPYYYHNKSKQTVWIRPEGFVIPLGIIQHTALGRRLSQTKFEGYPQSKPVNGNGSANQLKPQYRRSRSYTNEPVTPIETSFASKDPHTPPNHPNSRSSPSSSSSKKPYSNGYYSDINRLTTGTRLPPIPGSDRSAPPSIASRKSEDTRPSTPKEKPRSSSHTGHSTESLSPSRYPPSSSKHASFVTRTASQPQSLNAAVEFISNSNSNSDKDSPPRKSTASRADAASGGGGGGSETGHENPPRSSTSSRRSKKDMFFPSRRGTPPPSIPSGGESSSRTVHGKPISAPIMNNAAALNMSPVKSRKLDRPMPVNPLIRVQTGSTEGGATMSTDRSYPALPDDLASDILQFSESDFARQYFATHKTGFMFRRTVPVAQMMVWQKAPLSSPLLTMNRSLSKDAVKLFKVIQYVMGDRERDRSISGVRRPDIRMTTSSTSSVTNGFVSSQNGGNMTVVWEEERWLLNEGLAHGELRDEIYCQIMKQLNGNPNPESVFKGWQLMCVLLVTFPPSKNFETYLRSFIQQRTTHTEGRVDIMAKHCLRRLALISKKGPRGKAPSLSEIEIASDAAFNPSTFGESLDAIFRLQERTYPHQKVPIILPFLADGILALGGAQHEGIFRVPGDGDLVTDLKLRIDRGYYSLEGVDDPHVLASLIKLWLRELTDPVVPAEMYNECITSCRDPEACVEIVKRLPTINRRVVLFVVSFLQSFLEERVQKVTKMTPVNLALVMAPNLLRCDSESMTVVFTNAQFEQCFVYTLLMHLKCGEVDPEYVPVHGVGSIQPSPLPASKLRSRRR